MRWLAALLILGACAAQPTPVGERVYTYEDARRELPLLQEVDFGKFDMNHDKVLDQSEFAGLSNFYYTVYRDRF